MWRGASGWRLQVLQVTGAVPILGPVLLAVLVGGDRVQLGGPPPHTVSLGSYDIAYPAANAAALLLLGIAALGTVVIVRAVRFAVTDMCAYRRRLAALEVSGKLRGAYVFRRSSPEAFCGGLLRPRVYVSTGAIGVLSPEELHAVIAHEMRHRRARDPLRLLVSRVAARAAFPPSLCRLIGERFVIVTELDADRAAVRASNGDRRPLASALLRIADNEVDPERVDALTGVQPDLRLPGVALFAGLLGVAAFCSGLWVSLREARMQASLALPGLSSKPCVLALAIVPSVAGLLARAPAGRLRRSARPQPTSREPSPRRQSAKPR
jgi:Zn-dependent protease with chaperone function